MSNTTFKRYGAPAATALVMALVLAACGGGGGNPGAVGGTGSGSTGNGGTGTGTGGTTVTASPTVTLSFANASGASTNALTGATPLTVKATVLDASKKPVPNAIVTFATDNALAVFSPTAGTALTDVNGVASVTMRAASIASGGAGTVTATSNVAGTTITGTSNYSVGATALSFSTLSAASTSIQAYESTELSVNVLSGSSLYTEQPINVTFKSVCADKGSATLATTVATNNGIAKTVYRDKGCGTNDLITVSADGIAKPATVTLAIAPPRAASVQFASATPVNQSLVIQGKGGIGRTETAVLTFKVVDIFGNPLPGQKVEFRRYPANADVTVNKTTDTTDASGNVVTTVNSGATATTFKVQALLPNTAANGNPDISTMSDSIVVTTGQPVQRAFSIATDKFNVEGLNVQSSPSNPAATISVSLGDAFLNPVPDGTPVVFQTNMGLIGTSDKGGCSTVNGTCSVPLRAQAPSVATPGLPATPCNATTPDNTRPGLVTVCASTTDGTNFLSARTAVFFSGGTADNTFLNGARVSFNAAAPNDLGSISASNTKVFQLQFNDVNFNPLPAGSTVAITSMLNGNAAAVAPATVPNIAPHNASNVDDPTGTLISGNQGSIHTFSVSSTTPTNCTTTVQSSFNVTVTTPAPYNSVTTIPFKLTFTCP
ncbi:Ig-like domain-containing protein [Massilia norwichensis]|uniref:Ig-like domain-containing protein n=1 Tax=Massilia norwichensis TaxID=1442366 RepID=UPI002805ADD9|nr:Ig-like domain-containing protein [Massilia norwichensis]